ncbi:MAG: UDP-N-acetylmuramoyl-tripeptide--D-alanyl-D-alanine ligase [Sedimentisphaerales bacterium]|jgi:UDP-N-acetylmuramoyl-tripeptide--D-alanyl-D-alanine ligase
MKEISLTNLAKIIKANHRASGTSYDVTDVSTDSRTVKSGDCFFAISGDNFDGHNFLTDVFAKGAACAVVSQDILPDKFPGKTILKVSDTIKALGDLARWYRRDCKFKVVAITGSAGKTTTRQIIYHVLSRHFKTYQSPKSFNNFIGLPLTLLGAEPNQQIIIVELGTNHPGEIEYLTRIALPDIALVINVYPAHLAGFGSVEKIAEEKLAVSKGLAPAGTLIINADCPPLLATARKAGFTFKTFSCSKSADFFARDISIRSLASGFTIDGVPVEIPLPGRGNVENALAAWAICSSLGISARDFADALKTISPVSMRTEMLQLGSITVISDCYNANPASMKNALDILANLAGSQKRRAVFICGDMAELGDAEQILHRQLGEQIANAGVNLLITLGNLAILAADVAKAKRPDIQTRCFADQTDLCNNLQLMIKDSDIILVKGSRINKLELVVDKLKKLFSEPQ